MADDFDEEGRSLADYANAAGQPIQPIQPPHGHALVRPTTGLAERVIGAQPVAIYRDEPKIMAKLKTMAAAAGKDWFYRYPVTTKGGGQNWIEGPSIKLANAVFRVVGNIIEELRELDYGNAWVFYVRLTDLENGSSMERAFRQHKAQVSIGGKQAKDAERQQNIAYQIGQSKAIRNCIVNFLQTYTDFAFEEAQNSLVDKIGVDLEGWRTRTLQGLANVPIDVARVERVIGRAHKDWLAPDVAQIVAMMHSIKDGMATVDETFPAIESAEAGGVATVAADAVAKAGPGEPQAPERGAAQPPPSEPAVSQDQLDAAYKLGQEAKVAGASKKAVPQQYRSPERAKEALAWTAGHDGAAKPTA
jgi:hypothetical protein